MSDAKGSKDRFLGLLGLAKRAGKVIAGAPLIFTAMHKGKPPLLVIAASDASAPSQKKLTTQCEFYRVPLLTSAYTKAEICHAIGKDAEVAAVAITDGGLAGELQKLSGKDVSEPVGNEEK